MSGADLAHLHFDFECGGQGPNQLPEIHPLLGRVVKRALGPVTLELNIAQLHLKVVLGDDLSGFEQGALLPFFGRLPRRDVLHGRLANDPLDFVGVLDPFGLHLGPDQLSGEGDNAHVFAGIGVHHGDIARLDTPPLADAEIALPVSLEPDFHDVKCALAFRNRNPFQPIEHGHDIATAVAAIAVGPAAERLSVLSFLA